MTTAYVTYSHPIMFRSIGQDLPPGMYKVTSEEAEIDGVWKVLRCHLHISAGILSPDDPGAVANVSEHEIAEVLLQRHWRQNER